MSTGRNTYLFLLAGLLAMSSFTPASPGRSWTLLKEKNGIRISHRPSQRSAFNDLRVEADLPGSPQSLCAMLLNVRDYPNWAYACRNTKWISPDSASKRIYYSEIAVPWPATNRDLYAAIEVRADSVRGEWTVVCTGQPKTEADRSGFVRIPFSRGTWIITRKTLNEMHVDYTLEADPGGTAPAWIINLVAAKGPYETFSNLQERLSKAVRH